MDKPITTWLPIAKVQAMIGNGVLSAKKPFPNNGIKKNHGIITLINPKTIPSIYDAFKT
jgi:hypothetical protein